MTALVDILLSLSLVATWAAVFVVIPSAQRSRLRAQIWHVRDDLLDDIRAGHYAESIEQAHKLHRELTITLDFASALTAGKLLAFGIVTRTFRPSGTYEGVDLGAISDPGDRALLAKRVDAFHAALADHFFFGGPSGWLIVLFVVPYILAIELPAALMAALRTRSRKVIVQVYRTAVDKIKAKASQEQLDFLPELAHARSVA